MHRLPGIWIYSRTPEQRAPERRPYPLQRPLLLCINMSYMLKHPEQRPTPKLHPTTTLLAIFGPIGPSTKTTNWTKTHIFASLCWLNGGLSVLLSLRSITMYNCLVVFKQQLSIQKKITEYKCMGVLSIEINTEVAYI